MLPSWYVISIIYKYFFQVNLVFSQRNRSHMQRILLLLPWLYHGLLFGKLTIIINYKINNVAAQFKKKSLLPKGYFSLQTKMGEHKEHTFKILPTCPLGLCVKNVLPSLKDFFLLGLKALFSVIPGSCYHGNQHYLSSKHMKKS